MQPIIQAKQIGIIYNQGKENEVQAIRDINIQIYPHEYIIIFGPSGCGKSTLLYTLAGLQTPSYGSILVKDRDLSSMSSFDKAKFRLNEIGLVFQAFYLVPSLSVLDNVVLPRIFEGTSRKDQLDSGMQLLEKFGIAEQAFKYANEISGGQQQRVAIARSLINNPDIIIADEPVGNLDSEATKNVMGLLQALNEVEQKTIILVTHNPEHLHYADRVFRMSDGTIVEEIINDKQNKKKIIRPVREVDAADADILNDLKDIPPELRMLLRTFRGLSDAQNNVLLIPFKAKQLLSHLTNEMTQDQTEIANRYIKEMLFGNINIKELRTKLDTELEKGGAGWNKQRVNVTIERLEIMMECVRELSVNPESAIPLIAKYINNRFHLGFKNEPQEKDPYFFRLSSILHLRIMNKIDRPDLIRWLDSPYNEGGLGLRSDIAARVAGEVEILMLLKYS